MPRIALYPGSFDPVTNGHLDVVQHAVALCDRLIVAIGVNPGKKSLFSTEERLEMVKPVCAPIAARPIARFECSTYDNLTVTAAQNGRRHHHDSGPARRHRPRLRDADRRHERDHGARGAHRVRSGVGGGPPDHRHTGAPDRWHGRRRSPRSCRRRSPPTSRPNSRPSRSSDPEFS